MTEDEMARVLHIEPIEPSAGFQARVMSQVRREAEATPPIPFPWRRVLWIPVALGASLAAPFVRPAVAAEGQAAGTWLWCFGAVAASAGVAIASRRLLRLRL